MRDHDAFLLREMRSRQNELLREAEAARRLHGAAPSLWTRLTAMLSRPAARPAPPAPPAAPACSGD